MSTESDMLDDLFMMFDEDPEQFNDWEQGFIKKNKIKLDGGGTLTERQADKVVELWEKHVG